MGPTSPPAPSRRPAAPPAQTNPPPEARPAWDDRKTDATSMAAIEAERVVAAAESLLLRAHAAA